LLHVCQLVMVRRRDANSGLSDEQQAGSTSAPSGSQVKATRTHGVPESPPLNPPAWSNAALMLLLNRSGRCLLAGLVPLIGVCMALPKVRQIHHDYPLCLDRNLFRRNGVIVPCNQDSQVQGHCITDVCHYVFSIWVSIQFLYNFVASCFFEPGYVPLQDHATSSKEKQFFISLPSDDADMDDASQTLEFYPRWCSYCQAVKPPRAHHSRRVGRCVLRMDHYCNATENIIGAHNHGHYILMVSFGFIGLFYATTALLWVCIPLWTPYWQLYAKLQRSISRRTGGFVSWCATGGPLSLMSMLVGMELPMMMIVVVVAWVMLGQLFKPMRAASRGVTVLETTADTLDGIKLPNGKVLMVSEGDFSRGSAFKNLCMLLGPNWRWRLLCPVRGTADAGEESSPTISHHLACRLKNIINKVSGTGKQ